MELECLKWIFPEKAAGVLCFPFAANKWEQKTVDGQQYRMRSPIRPLGETLGGPGDLPLPEAA